MHVKRISRGRDGALRGHAFKREMSLQRRFETLCDPSEMIGIFR
ncbi:hypothetical protein [Bradyrhizobium sp.]|jgi:hypothetical protein|nr:hypothetical protein [Bradyrhizobium sp.]HEV2157209.1 hypothetical protein [Bradyrhizobium sp.]